MADGNNNTLKELYDPKLSEEEFLKCYDRFQRAEFERFLGCDETEANDDGDEQTICALKTCGKEFHVQGGYWQETSGERNRFCSHACQRAYHDTARTEELAASFDDEGSIEVPELTNEETKSLRY